MLRRFSLLIGFCPRLHCLQREYRADFGTGVHMVWSWNIMSRAFPTASRYDFAAVSVAGPIRNISDTALWVAVYRAQESERADAVFRDPYARKLAGDRGMQIAAAMPFAERHSWSYTARTWLVDQIIEREVQQGADMVINLAAGLDSIAEARQ
jgi:hypothetical protein